MSTSSTELHFNERYLERVRLGDGVEVVLRTIRPEDSPYLIQGFSRLSPESRYLRFLTRKPQLSEKEVKQLTEVDGTNHFALVAFTEDARGRPREGLGVARFVRLPEEPEVAEAAITVVDQAQGKGLGSLLVRRLSAAARERGVETFRCEFLAQNMPIRRLLEEYAHGGRFELNEDVISAEVPVPNFGPTGEVTAGERGNIVYRLLGESARGTIQLRLRELLLKPERPAPAEQKKEP